MEPARAKTDGAHRLIVRKHRKNDLAGLGHRPGRVFEGCAPALEAFGLFPAQIIDGEPVTGLKEISGHAAAHTAGTDKTKCLHVTSGMFSASRS